MSAGGGGYAAAHEYHEIHSACILLRGFALQLINTDFTKTIAKNAVGDTVLESGSMSLLYSALIKGSTNL